MVFANGCKNAIVSKTMSRIKGKDTKIEVLLRKALWHEGIRYRKYYRIYDCHPDIVITKYKIVIFVMVCFGMGKIFMSTRLSIIVCIGIIKSDAI